MFDILQVPALLLCSVTVTSYSHWFFHHFTPTQKI